MTSGEGFAKLADYYSSTAGKPLYTNWAYIGSLVPGAVGIYIQ